MLLDLHAGTVRGSRDVRPRPTAPARARGVPGTAPAARASARRCRAAHAPAPSTRCSAGGSRPPRWRRHRPSAVRATSAAVHGPTPGDREEPAVRLVQRQRRARLQVGRPLARLLGWSRRVAARPPTDGTRSRASRPAARGPAGGTGRASPGAGSLVANTMARYARRASMPVTFCSRIAGTSACITAPGPRDAHAAVVAPELLDHVVLRLEAGVVIERADQPGRRVERADRLRDPTPRPGCRSRTSGCAAWRDRRTCAWLARHRPARPASSGHRHRDKGGRGLRPGRSGTSVVIDRRGTCAQPTASIGHGRYGSIATTGSPAAVHASNPPITSVARCRPRLWSRAAARLEL